LRLIRKTVLVFALASVFLWMPVRALAAPSEDEVVFGGTFTLEEGESVEGNLIVFGGTVEIQDGALINGDVVVFGGRLTLAGEVGGDVNQFGGDLTLANPAHISGDVNTVGGSFSRDADVQIDGEIIREARNISFDGRKPQTRSLSSLALNGLWKLFLVFAFAAGAVVFVLFWPGQTAMMAKTIVANPALVGAIGLMILAVALPVLAVLAITILLSPVSFIGVGLLLLAGAAGWIGLALEVGTRLGAMLNCPWAPGVSAGVGAFLLGAVYLGLDAIPCFGWLLQFALAMMCLGAAVLTRFGTRPYPTDEPAPVLETVE